MNTYFANFIHLFDDFNIEATIADVSLVDLLFLNVLSVQISDSNTHTLLTDECCQSQHRTITCNSSACPTVVYIIIIMVALCNRADHYIFILFLSSSSFFSPNLSGRRLDVYHTLAHGVALVRI